ncbi:MAG: glycosyltransferase family 1 protein [Gemmatimonadales bacterium]|nr:MAG: glycosyltransferase family 1 protein [Gemmatimonadales bacterium]
MQESGTHSDGVKQGVLYVISAFGGGTGSHLNGLLTELDRNRWSPGVLCNGHFNYPVPDDVTLIDDTASQHGSRFPRTQVRQLGTFRRSVRRLRPDIVHTYFFWPIFYARLLKRLGVVSHLVENREDEGFNWGAMEYRFLRLTSGIPDRIICVSNSVRDTVLEREGTPEARTVVIPNGIPIPDMGDEAPDLEALRSEFGLSPDQPVVGMVANLARSVKGGKYLIEALPIIARECPEARVLLVGHTEGLDPLLERAEALDVRDRLIVTGFRSDVDRLYPLMTVSVLTSLSEGLSITLLESMRNGLPVVATRVGGNPEVVEDGETGILVPPGDPEAFGSAVVKLLGDPALRKSMGRAGRDRVKRHFSISTVARRYESLYGEVLDGR